jgi:predicted dehydrogenase
MALRVGIVGAGKHGERYLRHVADVPELRLVALARRDRGRGEAQARAYGCRFHADAAHLIADPEVEAVVLVVPPTLNAELASRAARAGKHLLIEKPLATTLADCRRIAAAVGASGVTAMVAHTLRFNAVVAAIRAALPTIGRLHATVITQRFEPSTLAWLDTRVAGGGIVLHTGVHSFDLLRHLTGDEARHVSARIDRVATRDSEDNFIAAIEMERGTLALVGGSRATAGRSGAIELAGRDGQLVGDHVHGHAATLTGTERRALAVGAPVATVAATLREFAAAVRERRAPSITIADGAGSVAIAEACYRAAASGHPEGVERL